MNLFEKDLVEKNFDKKKLSPINIFIYGIIPRWNLFVNSHGIVKERAHYCGAKKYSKKKGYN